MARLPAAQRREQLLDVALQVFADQGYHQASMNEIAEAAGVTKPVLYQHFESKRELYLELLRDVASKLRTALLEATAQAEGPRDQVVRGFGAIFSWMAEDPARFGILFAGDTMREPDFAREASAAERTTATAIGDLIVIDGLDEDQRQLLGWGLVGITEVIGRQWVAGHLTLDTSEIAELAANLAWSGLRGARPIR